jgi:hypothetical protein
VRKRERKFIPECRNSAIVRQCSEEEIAKGRKEWCAKCEAEDGFI